MTEAGALVAVVGGGIAGLAAAHALQERGIPFLLLEASSRFGGVILTETAQGFLLEGGPDSILAQKPEGLALCRGIGLEDRLVPANPERRAVFVLRGGKLHPLPEGMALAVPTRIVPFLRSGLFSWSGKLRMGLDLVIPKPKDTGDESIASFLRRRFGQQAVERLGEPLLAGIHAGDPERLSIRATFPRFAEMEERYGSLIRGMWAARPPAAAGAGFYSLAGGLGQLVETLVSRLPAAQLRKEAAVSSLSREGGGFVLRFKGGDAVRAPAVLLAVPAPRAAPLLEPLVPEAARILAGIPFVSSATVCLGYRTEDVAHPLDGYGAVIPRTEGLRSSAWSFVSTKFPGRAPEGKILLRGFVGGRRDPGVLELDDAALSTLVHEEMAPLLGLRGQPVLSRVYRWPSATPQMEVGHEDRIARVERLLAVVPGLFLTGAGLRGAGIPDVIADARKVAAAAAGGRLPFGGREPYMIGA